MIINNDELAPRIEGLPLARKGKPRDRDPRELIRAGGVLQRVLPIVPHQPDPLHAAARTQHREVRPRRQTRQTRETRRGTLRRQQRADRREEEEDPSVRCGYRTALQVPGGGMHQILRFGRVTEPAHEVEAPRALQGLGLPREGVRQRGRRLLLICIYKSTVPGAYLQWRHGVLQLMMEICLKNDNEDHSVIRHYLGMTMNQMRHLEVSRIIEANSILSVLDLGCSEGLLLQKLSRSESIQLLVGIDMDGTAVSSAVLNTFPENIQQSIQFQREVDQHIYIYDADATKRYPLLREKKPQLVTMAELIEHLSLEDVGKAVDNVFGYLQPQFCFISTPNREFNAFFAFQEGQTRHYDHKFQWNRLEFQTFCEDIRKKYGYQFTLGGIGEHITDDSKGHCTQFALFTRPSSSLANNQTANGVCLIQGQDELEERAHYENISWRNNKPKIIRNTLFKSLYFSEDLSLDEGVQFMQKEAIGQCLLKDGLNIDRSFLLDCLQQNQADFENDGDRYRVKRSKQEESQEEEAEQQVSHSAHMVEGSSYELSISKSNLFEKEEDPQI